MVAAISKMAVASSMPGVARMRAFLRGEAFAPHRHDTYAIGVTTDGIQSFGYRGASHGSVAGQVFVLHPDELHDGRQGDDRGFGYRIAYIDPVLVRDAAQCRSLPFLPNPLVSYPRLCKAVRNFVSGIGTPLDDLAATSHLSEIAHALVAASGRGAGPGRKIDTRAVGLARDFLRAAPEKMVSIAELETIAGLSRWQLARQFRDAFGVSPTRYHLLRRLEHARSLIVNGISLARVAQTVGFADQAHLSRHFRDAFGMSPGRWRRLYATTFEKKASVGRSI
jgi:AraC-like DNA-binding protein